MNDYGYEIDCLFTNLPRAGCNFFPAPDIRRYRVQGLKAQIVSVIGQRHGLEAEVEKAQYNLDHSTIVAPADTYLVDMQLRPGAFIRLKQPSSAQRSFILASVDQRYSIVSGKSYEHHKQFAGIVKTWMFLHSGSGMALKRPENISRYSRALVSHIIL